MKIVVGIMLYRSDNGDDYFPIEELEFPEGGGILEICDEFNPDTPVQIRLWIQRLLMRNGNLSPLFPIPADVSLSRSKSFFDSSGQRKWNRQAMPASPSALVTWFGPKAGVASYIIRFETPGGRTRTGESDPLPEETNPPEYYNDVYRPVSALFYDEEKSLFSLFGR